MRRRFSILICCLTVVLSQAPSAQAQSAKPQTSSVAEKLIGAWQLVSIETIGPHGAVTYRYYGKHPEGLLIYDRSGWMCKSSPTRNRWCRIVTHALAFSRPRPNKRQAPSGGTMPTSAPGRSIRRPRRSRTTCGSRCIRESVAKTLFGNSLWTASA
jgi:hypothetical protein